MRKTNPNKTITLLRTSRWRKALGGLAVGALLSLGTNVSAQVNAYAFTPTTGTFTPLAGGTATSLAATTDDAISTAFNIGFSFVFNGVTYTQVMASSNGPLLFGTGRTATATNNLATTTLTQRPGVAALWDDLQCTSGVTYQLSGTSPNQVLTVEWLNMEWNYASVTAVISYQVKLYETTNVVEFIYRQDATAVNSGSASIGIMGATAADYISLQNTSGAPTTSTSASTNTLATKPATGQIYRFTPPTPCAGAPNAGTSATPVTTCSGNTVILNATGLSSGVTGLSFQWEESPDGSIGWANVVGGTGATTASYTTTAVNVTRYFRLRSTCANGGGTNTTNVVTVSLVNPTYLVFNGVGHSESFESWSSLCSTTDVPTTNWKNTPATGNNSWRRNDQGASAAWTGTSGAYSPVFSQGAFSARFHTYDVTSGTKGNLDLYVDMTAGSGNNGLTFDFINTSGTDSITILQSTDGGLTFAQLGARLQTAATWTAVSRTITSTSATTIIRLHAHSDYGLTDIGIDNLQITSPCAGTPTPGATTGPASACSAVPFNLGLTNATSGNGVSYQWYVSTTSNTGPWTPVVTTPTYTASQTQQSWYYADVTCSSGPSTGSSSVLQVNMSAPNTCYCTPIYTTGKTDGDLLSNVVIVGTTLANNTGNSPVNPAYTYFNTLPNHTASLQAGTSYTIQATVGTFGTQNIAVWIDFNDDGVFTTPAERVGYTTTSVGANGTGTFTLTLPCNPTPGLKRMRVRDIYSGTGIGIDPCTSFGYGETEDYDVTILPPPACPAPSALAFNSVTSNSANITWNLGCVETAWEIEYGPAGFTLGTGTTVAATSPYALGSLSSATAYDVYVRANCGINGVSASVGPVNFTTLPPPPANDECANATNLTVNTDYACGSVTAGTIASATASAEANSCFGTDDDDVWYTFTATSTAHRVSLINITGSTSDMMMAISSGSCGSLTSVLCSDPETADLTGLTIGVVYTVRVYTYTTTPGQTSSFNICVGTPPPPPANDLCANAIAVGCNTITNATTVASTNTGAPTGCVDGLNTAGGIWYTLAGFDGPMTVDLSGSSFDTKIGIFTGTCGSLVCLASDDDGGTGLTSLVSFAGSSAQTYYIYVTGFSTNTGTVVMKTVCGSNNNACTENGLAIEFQTDNTPFQNTWDLLDATGQFVVVSGGPLAAPGALLQEFACVPDGCYQFRVNDSGGNGMGTGGYVVRTQGTNIRIIDNANNFNSGSVSTTGQAFCLPLGTVELLYSSCDKYFWANGEYVVCNEDAAVAADYNGGGAAGADSGYDFWFFDPNGTYSYVRSRRHNVSDNFANVGSSRTCHMKINNWTGNQIPNGLKLNVRVRPVVNGVAGAYGPACRFTRDEATAACPPTLLYDVPGFPQFYSCGVSRNFVNNTANRLYARPVGGATQYRFTFTNAELVTPIVRTSNAYYINLGWTNGPALIAGQSYDVTVEAFKGGVWCIPGSVCIVTINNLVAGGQQNVALDGGSALNMWPNPNNGEVLNMSLHIADPFISTVSMDIFDLSGKRMVARTVGIQDGFLNTTIDLNGDLAVGMYMVKVTAGEEVFTQRVVIQK